MRPTRCGNAGAVESVESQKQASHSFHEPLGNLANGRRDSHISTAPATRADGKVENQKQVFHFPTAPIPLSQEKTQKPAASFARAGEGAWRSDTSVKSRGPATECSRPAGADVPQTRSMKGDVAQQHHFRLTPHWNRRAVSGSSRIGINFRFQAHLWIGKCWGPELRAQRIYPSQTFESRKIAVGRAEVQSMLDRQGCQVASGVGQFRRR
jgi:hypothetical protein